MVCDLNGLNIELMSSDLGNLDFEVVICDLFGFKVRCVVRDSEH